ncbi:hypothetical protein, conserved [Leishmania tarentolae]|uniref:Uncharacterized protein n=1 Tax=Leishmania tarentolae TaxID=5689 RepID=A0A640KAK7_LEITA|nr:hypothetical protein, conserved [Leishmania tarentolae]
MSGVSSAPLTDAEVRELSTPEIRVNLERCTRLLSQTSLLQRLRDGGEGIRRRHELFTKELDRRHAVEVDTPDASARLTSFTLTEALKRENEVSILSESTHDARDAAREIAQKYKDQRIDVEATVRRMYEGILSEGEIQRTLRSVPPGFFLTYTETCERERQLARDARKAELQRLAAQAARFNAIPQ